MAAFAYEPETAENKALQKEVQLKLRDHLGPTYNDDILPLCAMLWRQCEPACVHPQQLT